MLEFLKEYIESYVECNEEYATITVEEIAKIAEKLMDNEELWETVDTYILAGLKDYKYKNKK